MSIKNLLHSSKQEDLPRDSQEESRPRSLSEEELRTLSMEMNWGYGMLPPAGFLDGIWHFY